MSKNTFPDRLITRIGHLRAEIQQIIEIWWPFWIMQIRCFPILGFLRTFSMVFCGPHRNSLWQKKCCYNLFQVKPYFAWTIIGGLRVYVYSCGRPKRRHRSRPTALTAYNVIFAFAKPYIRLVGLNFRCPAVDGGSKLVTCSVHRFLADALPHGVAQRERDGSRHPGRKRVRNEPTSDRLQDVWKL